MHNNNVSRRAAALLWLSFLCTTAALGRGAPTLPQGVVTASGVAYFTSENTFCRTDATPDGTRCFAAGEGTLGAPVLLNGTIYAVGRTTPRVLYAFDGQHDPRAVMTFGARDLAGDLATNGRQLFYLVTHEIPDGVRLMRTDGTETGTSLVRLLGTDLAKIVGRAGDSLLLQINHTEAWSPNRRLQDLWRSDGTREGTALLLPGNVSSLTPLGPLMLFRYRGQLWRTDGTPTGTFLLVDFVGDATPTVRDGFAYLTAQREVWRTDGTTAIPLRTVGFDPELTGVASRRLYFVEQQQDAVVVWGSGDTYGVPAVLARIPHPQPRYYKGPQALVHTGTLAFFTLVFDDRYELWRSDGTAAGTFRVRSFGWWSLPSLLTPLGEKLLFFADDGIHGTEPWISDGTRAGTVMLANLTPEGTVQGRVTDAATGLPVPGAIVELPYTNPPASVRTNADGRYTFEGLRGTYSLQARSDSHLLLVRTVTVAANETATRDFALRRGGRIAGRVSGGNGKPLAGVRVQIYGTLYGDSRILVTGNDGRFASAPLSPDDRWTVLVAGKPVLPEKIRVAAGETRQLDITL